MSETKLKALRTMEATRERQMAEWQKDARMVSFLLNKQREQWENQRKAQNIIHTNEQEEQSKQNGKSEGMMTDDEMDQLLDLNSRNRRRQWGPGG